jgi:cytidine deaminase
MELEALLEIAFETAKNSYSPYSHFSVGAALLGDDGKVYTGVNVENRSYGLTICAERSAICSAVSSGCKVFTALAIAAPDSKNPVGPCGACRQVISEFMPATAPVICGGSGKKRITMTISELIPFDSLHDLQEL